ncbi:MAG: hypothetical protein GY953_31395, partial [bacterium]|nr:hypothetical protein [bacterium]
MSETAQHVVADAGAHEAASSQEAQEGKVLAVLSYVIGIVALVVLIMRNNRFALYHGKQALTLFIA